MAANLGIKHKIRWITFLAAVSLVLVFLSVYVQRTVVDATAEHPILPNGTLSHWDRDQEFVIENEEYSGFLFLNRYDKNKKLLYSNRIQNYENAAISMVQHNCIVICYDLMPQESSLHAVYDTLCVSKELPEHFFFNGNDTIIYKYQKRE